MCAVSITSAHHKLVFMPCTQVKCLCLQFTRQRRQRETEGGRGLVVQEMAFRWFNIYSSNTTISSKPNSHHLTLSLSWRVLSPSSSPSGHFFSGYLFSVVNFYWIFFPSLVYHLSICKSNSFSPSSSLCPLQILLNRADHQVFVGWYDLGNYVTLNIIPTDVLMGVFKSSECVLAFD